MGLSVCPGFFVALLFVLFITVIVEQPCVVHQRVYCVDDVFIGDHLSSVISELLYLLDTLHQLLERSVCVPRLQQLRAISYKVLFFHLSVLSE